MVEGAPTEDRGPGPAGVASRGALGRGTVRLNCERLCNHKATNYLWQLNLQPDEKRRLFLGPSMQFNVQLQISNSKHNDQTCQMLMTVNMISQ